MNRLVGVYIVLVASAIAATGQDQRVIYAPHGRVVTIQPSSVAAQSAVSSSSGAFWTPIANAPPVMVGAMLLLTDGRVLVHSEPNYCSTSTCIGDYGTWYTLTPDNTGSYVNGTWAQVASLPNCYGPLYFASAVLPDGKVVVEGGEYNFLVGNGTCSRTSPKAAGAIYDPGPQGATANSWTSTTPTPDPIMDAQSVVLSNGTWMVADNCTPGGIFGVLSCANLYYVYYYFNESTLSFTDMSNGGSGNGKYDTFPEEGWTLLPSKRVLTVDKFFDFSQPDNSEIYNPATNTWSSAGSTINQLSDPCQNANNDFEMGPAVLRPDGTVFAAGASTCGPAHTAIYNSGTRTWSPGPNFPNDVGANDAPAALEINGNVIVEASPATSSIFSSPASFYEWDGSSFYAFPAPPNAVNTPSLVGHLLVLPNGQIMYTDFSTDVEFLTSAGTYDPSWQPTISSAPSVVTEGGTYSISGMRFNGLSQANAYGDDFQNATNYPLVRIVNNATGHVFYCKTHNHSTMAVATGSAIVSTKFDVPNGATGTGAQRAETGPSELFVVANGIPSAPVSVDVRVPSSTSLTSSLNPSLVTQSVTFTAQLVVFGVAPTGTVTFKQGTTVLGSVPVSGGQASLTTAFSTAGTYSITAVYSGDLNLNPSTSNVLKQVVKNIPTTTTLISSSNPSSVGQVVTFSATVWSTLGHAPDGETVRFTDGSTTLGTGALSFGVATFSTSALSKGTHSIKATYSGDSQYLSSTSAKLSQVVNGLPSSTFVASNLNPSTYGQSVTFTATVVPQAGSGPTPTGTVTFKAGTTVLAQGVALTGVTATFATSTLSTGTKSITAVYNGDPNYAPSISATLSQVVNKANTTTSISSSVNPSNLAQSVTFTITVAPQITGTPTGSVTLKIGATTLTTATLSGGTATYSTTSLPTGSDVITATYNGSSNFNRSSVAITQTVNP